MTYKVWDVETTIKILNKRKASPFSPDNWVVASGWKMKGMAAAVADYFGRKRPHDGWFRELLDGVSILVGFNIKFDILHAIQSPDNYRAWMEWVANGGRVWDTQLAEYLLHGMAREHHMLSLDEVAPRYGGHLKNDAVKALWNAGISTEDIDQDLLLEYLIGSKGNEKDQGDIGNTELVFLGQVAALRARGSLQSVMMNMDSLIFTIEAEHNGMYVDRPRGLELAEKLTAELNELRVGLQDQLPKDLPFTFNWGSRFHLSALIFGGDVKYKAKANILDDDGNPTYYQKDQVQYILTDGNMTPFPPGHEVELKMYATFAGGKNKGEFKTKKVKVPDIERGPKQRIEDFYYKFPGYTTPLPEWEGATKGVYSTSAEVIASLEHTGIPFLEQLSKMAAVGKDLGTYFITTDEETGEQKGMLTLVGDDGIIHHSINHTSTVTGRFSSSNPNLQNVPKGEKSDVKSVFVSRFTGGWIVQSDFTSLEIYVQAILTNCKQMILDLLQKLDMHVVRLSQKLGKTYEEIYHLYKSGDHDIKVGRTHAKVFSFQRAYGAGVAKISKSTGIPVEDVEALIRAETERYPEVDEFYAKLTQEIIGNRVPTSRFVQHPVVPGVTCQLGRSHYFTPDGTMYSYSESPAPDFIVKHKDPAVRAAQSFSPTEIKNYVVQGTGAMWAKAAMALVVRAFYKHKNFGGLALLVNQVHDAVYGDFDDSVKVQAAALLHACMEEASAYMEHTFKWHIKCPVPTETKIGTSMIEELDMPSDFSQHVATWRTWVRETFMPNFKMICEQEKEHECI